MRKVLLLLILLASALPGCGPGLDTDSFHPGSVDGALFWYKPEKAELNGNIWYWAESLGNQTGLSLTGTGALSLVTGSQGQRLLSLSSSSYFSMAYPNQPLSLAEFTVYAVFQRLNGVDSGIFGILSNDLIPANCGTPTLSLHGNSTTLQIHGEIWNGSNLISTSLPAYSEPSVVELHYGSDGTLRLRAAGLANYAYGSAQSITISAPKVALGAACQNMQATPSFVKGNLSLGEVLFYNRAVSDSESLRIRRYLMLRHGVTQ